jgi:hypothetical protein
MDEILGVIDTGVIGKRIVRCRNPLRWGILDGKNGIVMGMVGSGTTW